MQFWFYKIDRENRYNMFKDTCVVAHKIIDRGYDTPSVTIAATEVKQ
jgi:ribosomal protein L18E